VMLGFGRNGHISVKMGSSLFGCFSWCMNYTVYIHENSELSSCYGVGLSLNCHHIFVYGSRNHVCDLYVVNPRLGGNK
jgi:hypothetical protein